MVAGMILGEAAAALTFVVPANGWIGLYATEFGRLSYGEVKLALPETEVLPTPTGSPLFAEERGTPGRRDIAVHRNVH